MVSDWSPCSPPLPQSPPRWLSVPHEGQDHVTPLFKTPQMLHLSKGKKSKPLKNRSLGPHMIHMLLSKLHPQSFISLTSTACHFLCSPSQTGSSPLAVFFPTHWKPCLPLPPRRLAFLCSYQVFSWLSLSSSLCSKLLSSRPSHVYPPIKYNCPSMTLCPFPRAIFPLYSTSLLFYKWLDLLGLFLQSIMSTFEHKTAWWGLLSVLFTGPRKIFHI